MPDLTTTYLGLKLKNPLVPSASPLSKSLDTLKRLEDAGAGAVVMYSLFEEQINAESHTLDYYLTQHAESYAEALSYFPEPNSYRLSPDQYLQHIHAAKMALSIPVIGSLNGVSAGGWVKYAKKIEQAGADALELNMYFVPTDPEVQGNELEAMYLELVHNIQQEISIPLAVKLSPFFTSIPNMARRFVYTGARGLVLFNRFYQPDFDLELLDVVPRPALSTALEPQALRLPLRWIAILYGRLNADLALTSGVHSAEDVVKGLMAGASVVMLASELLIKGVDRLADILADLNRWLEEHEYASVAQLRGSMSQKSVAFPAAFERAHYVRAISQYELA